MGKNLEQATGYRVKGEGAACEGEKAYHLNASWDSIFFHEEFTRE